LNQNRSCDKMFLLPEKVSVEVNKKIYNESAGCGFIAMYTM